MSSSSVNSLSSPLPSTTTTKASSTTIVIGLNAALQKRFVLPNDSSILIPGNVHRAKEVQIGVGGKGQDVAISLNCLNYLPVGLQLAQFVGHGASGDLVQSLLRDRLGDVAAQALTVRPTNSDLRTCTSIVGSQDTTELVEPSGIISDEDMATFLDQLSSAKESVVAGMVIMGSMPPGCPDDTYAQIYQRVAGPSTLCLVDSVTGTISLLQTIAESNKQGKSPPMLFKVNASELCKLAGVKKSSNSETGGVVLEELQDAIRQFLFDKYAPFAIPAIAALAITDGAHPGYLCTIENKKGESSENCELNLFRLPVPALTTTSDLEASPKTLYPIGAGDSVAAGTLAAWHCLHEPETKDILPAPVQEALASRYNSYLDEYKDHKDAGVLVTAFAFGLACGSASCLEEENSVLKLPDVLRLFQRIGQPQFVTQMLSPITK